MSGKLIVMEAGDGSGKATQAALLFRRCKETGKAVRQISFPDYDSPSSALVKMYLRGEFGSEAATVNAYAASLFYAVDRFASYQKNWRKFLEDGGIVIADRYVTSNMAHQAAKITDAAARKKFLAWLCDLEYEKLALPKPDKVIFLDMPPSAAQKLIAARVRASDIHEKDGAYLERAYAAYCALANDYGWERIPCADDTLNPLPIDVIHNRIWAALERVL